MQVNEVLQETQYQRPNSGVLPRRDREAQRTYAALSRHEYDENYMCALNPVGVCPGR